ncbi:MAG: hypothetical protein KDB80_04325 [Planctomycetes bacterium]|nr:hypothetical protein [Planctomycetota bacterium]
MRILLSLAMVSVAPFVAAQNISHPPPATPANHLSLFVTGLDIEGNMGGFSGTSLGSETAISMSTTACNPGSVEGEWESNPSVNHPLINQMYCRLYENRFEQISNYGYGKHSFGSTNSNGCGYRVGCQGAAFNRLGLNCSDTYGSGLNWNRGDLGPLTEWNSWTGEFTFFGSHIDTGYPETTPNGSPSSINPANSMQFRQRIPHSKIGTAGATYFAMGYYLHKWEPEGNRENNMVNKQISLSTTGAGSIGSQLYGNVMEDRYTGARVESSANEVGGTAYDGRFYVGVHVSNNGDGTWHYEYAVHNRDNHAGNVRFVVPCSTTATVTNIGTKDVDLDSDPFAATNDWTGTHAGNCIIFDPGPNARPQGWNTIYNFWFDCDAAPTNGSVEIFGDISRLNPGANPSVVVASDVPNVAPANEDLGEGCGLDLSITDIASPGAAVGINVSNGAPGASAAAHIAAYDNSFALFPPFGPTTCTILTPDFVLLFPLDGGGSASTTFNIPNDNGLIGVQFHVQGAALLVGGPVLGVAELSNRIRVPVCP